MSLHVECGLALLAGTNIQPIEIGSSLQWSQTLGTAGVATTNSAPPAPNANNTVVFTVSAEIDLWVSIGTSPDATAGTALRRRMFAKTTRSFTAPVGTKVIWAAT